jgi:methyl-accepting chemotaxis protein
VALRSAEATATVKNVSAAANELSLSVDSAATEIEVMSATLNEIAQNCLNESKVASGANDKAASIEALMQRLEAFLKRNWNHCNSY